MNLKGIYKQNIIILYIYISINNIMGAAQSSQNEIFSPNTVEFIEKKEHKPKPNRKKEIILLLILLIIVFLLLNIRKKRFIT